MDKFSHLSDEYMEYLKKGYSQRYLDADDPWYTDYVLEDRYLDDEKYLDDYEGCDCDYGQDD